MENVSLFIVTEDREYGKALGIAILNSCNTFIITISGKKEFISRGNRGDLILWDGEEARAAYGGNIILLSEKPSMTMEDLSNNRYSLYKYCSADIFVGSLLEIYSRLTGRRAINTKRVDTKILSFSSWAGGTGCTTLTVAVGRELCRFHKKRVLYISLEEIESTGAYFRDGDSLKSMSQYLYEIFAKEGQYGFPESYLIKDDFGIEAFAPTRGRNPLLDMNREETCHFLSNIMNSGRFDYVLADVSSCLMDVGNVFLEMADKICMVTPYTVEGEREARFLSHLTAICGGDIRNKIIKVENMTKENTVGRSEEEPDNQKCLIKTDFYIKNLIYEGDFGRKVQGLTKEMTQT